MKRVLSMTGIVCTLWAASAAAQGRTPGAEQARIAYFAGEWTLDAESEGLKFTISQTCEWFEGGFHLVCRGVGNGGLGRLKDQAILGYDAGSKSYTLHTINSLGNGIAAKGAVNDKVWTWDAELAGASEPLKARLTITEDSPTSYTMTLRGLIGREWMVLEQARARRIK
jgi:uncharacterized protein DUF1579